MLVGPHLLSVIVLGGSSVYFVPMGVGGGAKSTFPCLRYPSGKYLCAGSPRLIQELMVSTGGSPPSPWPSAATTPS